MRILLIEDDHDLSELLQSILNKKYPLDYDKNMDEAMAHLQAYNYGIVLLDRNLEGVDIGLSLITMIKERNPQCGILVISAYGNVEEKIEVVEADVLTAHEPEKEVIETVVVEKEDILGDLAVDTKEVEVVDVVTLDFDEAELQKASEASSGDIFEGIEEPSQKVTENVVETISFDEKELEQAKNKNDDFFSQEI